MFNTPLPAISFGGAGRIRPHNGRLYVTYGSPFNPGPAGLFSEVDWWDETSGQWQLFSQPRGTEILNLEDLRWFNGKLYGIGKDVGFGVIRWDDTRWTSIGGVTIGTYYFPIVNSLLFTSSLEIYNEQV